MSDIEPSNLSKVRNTLLPTLTAILEYGVQRIPNVDYKGFGVLVAPFIAVILTVGIKHLFKRYNCWALIRMYNR